MSVCFLKLVYFSRTAFLARGGGALIYRTRPPPMTIRCWFLSSKIALHTDLTSTLLKTISKKSYLPKPPSPAGFVKKFGSNATALEHQKYHYSLHTV